MTANIPLKICISLAIVALLGTYGIRCIVFNRMESKLPELLQELESKNIHASIKSIETSWYNNTISLKGVSFTNEEPNSVPMSIGEGTISTIKVKGFQLLPFLISKNICLDSLIVGKVKIIKYKNSKTITKSDTKRFFELGYIKIDSLEITELDTLDKPVMETRLSFETNDLTGSLPLTDDLHSAGITVSAIRVDMPKAGYSLTVNSIRLENLSDLRIDSLRVTPLYSKIDFSRKLGYETDRFDGVIPLITITGINSDSLLKNNLAIRKIELSFTLDVYRDKRVRNVNEFKPLPDSLLRKLPMAVMIDSIILRESNLTYEEFGEKADSAGSISFKKLSAELYDISNKDPKQAFEMDARARFMNDGEIAVHGTFSNSRKPHRLQGSLKNFRLTRINRMLKPNTGIAIESGKLELLRFDFKYNNHQSDGELLLNYHDLKVLSFRENNKDEAVPNVAKTFLMNAFIENDLDKDDSRAKRTGTIQFERDKNKFIFNFWWKSLLSGLKSAAGIPGKKPQAAS